MIPYDDLVAALATWRARQGLSVAQPAGAAPAPTAKGSPAPAGKTPPARAPSSPQPVVRAPAPAPPRPATSPRPAVAAPPALSGRNDFDDSEGAAVDADHYENTGDDFVMSVADDSVETGEATAIGGAPESPADGPKRGKRNPDW